eukprot:4107553-Prorocentrum_lima.AAC.1
MQMAEGDEAIIKNRTCESTRLMVEVDPALVRLVESRRDLQLVWTSSGYSKVHCSASGRLLPVTLSAVEEYVYGK